MKAQTNTDFKGNKDLCNIGKTYSNDPLCNFSVFSLHHFETFDILLL